MLAKTAGQCTSAEPHAAVGCAGDGLAWFDDCGVPGDAIETCFVRCDDGVCTSCYHRHHLTCEGAEIQWVDSCGELGGRERSCEGAQTCTLEEVPGGCGIGSAVCTRATCE